MGLLRKNCSKNGLSLLFDPKTWPTELSNTEIKKFKPDNIQY